MREVPTKNYVLLCLIFIVTVIIVLYINAWAKTYKEDKLSVSPLSGVLEEIGPEEITQSLSEINEVILYVGYNNSQKLYDSENNLLDYIKKHDLADKVLYVNVSNSKEDNGYIEILKESFSNMATDIVEAPMLIYVKNGKAIEVIKSTKGIIRKKDISILNKTYELE